MNKYAKFAVLTPISMLSLANAYVRTTTATGAPVRRGDSSNIQFMIHEPLAAGMTNADGRPMITANSDPLTALKAAAATWSNIASSSIRFAPLGSTSHANDPTDNINTLVFLDTPEIRTIVGSAVAITVVRLVGDQITETDIIFNPNIIRDGRQIPFSTNLAPGTIDLQSVATHELGHALGANHSGLTSATMFYDSPVQTNYQATLSADDVAFAFEAYPAAGAESAFGSIDGRVLSSVGEPMRGALVVAIDPAAGVAVGGLSRLADGAYSIKGVPPGNYLVYSEPLTGVHSPPVFGLTDAQVDTSFQPSFAGGSTAPRMFAVTGGGDAMADVMVRDGPSPLAIQLVALGRPGESGDLRDGYQGAKLLTAGTAVDIILATSGLDTTITESDIRLLGPGLTIRPGSLSVDSNLSIGGAHPLRFTVDIALQSASAVASIAIVTSSAVAVYSGALRIQGVVLAPDFSADSIESGASFAQGAIAPGEIISIFGSRLGPNPAVTNTGFDPSTGKLPSSLGGVTVNFDGVPAPLFYVSSSQLNLQAPFELAGKPNTQVVVQFGQMTSARVQVPVTVARPGVFTLTGSRRAIAINQDGSLNDVSSPAPRGSAIVVYGTGQGVVGPPLATGSPAPANPLSGANAVTMTIGGQPAQVLFAGMTPGFVGLFQVNAVVPETASVTSLSPMQISVGGVSSQPGVAIAVK